MEIKFSNSRDVPKLPKFVRYRNNLGLQYTLVMSKKVSRYTPTCKWPFSNEEKCFFLLPDKLASTLALCIYYMPLECHVLLVVLYKCVTAISALARIEESFSFSSLFYINLFQLIYRHHEVGCIYALGRQPWHSRTFNTRTQPGALGSAYRKLLVQNS